MAASTPVLAPSLSLPSVVVVTNRAHTAPSPLCIAHIHTLSHFEWYYGLYLPVWITMSFETNGVLTDKYDNTSSLLKQAP